jgi:hypothetical protein
MDLSPFPRCALKQMKAVEDEKKRQEYVRKFVKITYNEVLRVARSSTMNKYTVHLQIAGTAMPTSEHTLHPNDVKIVLENQDEILEQLRELFPDCAVGIKTLSRGANGQYYDASTLDESALRFIDKRYDQTHLVVDWS